MRICSSGQDLAGCASVHLILINNGDRLVLNKIQYAVQVIPHVAARARAARPAVLPLTEIVCSNYAFGAASKQNWPPDCVCDVPDELRIRVRPH